MFDKLKAEDGAGLTEFAIMSVLLVPIVMVGVYASESMSTALKVREAEVSSAWAATGYRLHNYLAANGTGSRFSAVGDMVARRTKSGLRDFDSAQDLANRGANLIATDSRLTALDCSALNRAPFTPANGSSFLNPNGWLRCKAHASLEADNIPTYNSPGEKKKFTDYGVLLNRLRNINLQGMGPNGMVVLANDWALENSRPTAGSGHIGDEGNKGNPQYWTAGSAVFQDSLRKTGYPTNIVQTAMRDLLGSNDQGNTDGYKVGYLGDITQTRSVPTSGANVRAHLTPHAGDMMERQYYKRDDGNYLGIRDASSMGND